MNTQKKFQKLLRELFEFDSADLDFGIYRILNHKRTLIERWIETDLPQAIAEEFEKGALAGQAEAQKALEEARQKVLETLGAAAIDAESNLAEQYANTPLGKAYLEAQEKAAHAQAPEALEAAVYNHLYTFFSRYWQDGDFISKRRYAKKERYAIPYNGEEFTLYWANHDQYYVKTAEHFTDYAWKAPNGVAVHFKLQAADVEVNNVKGDKRFFLPVLDGIVWSSEAKALTIPFEYRPLTKQEETRYGGKNQQDNIIQEAADAIPTRLKGNAEPLAALSVERRKDAKGNPVSYLAHHLRQYTARNTRDFFIHKDLKGFLSRELDFYLKNEVLNLEELEAAGEGLSEGWFQLMRLIKRVGNHIIDFLAQIEEFQKALWEKKKFVTEAFYCITVGSIPEAFYPEIAENEAQWQEWRELFRIHELPGDLETVEGRIAFLKAHPTLVLDTRHFPQDFTDRLLASFGNLDEATDGLLVHSENWQALNLLLEKYRERVKCIYIDPPYNTEQDRQGGKFLYKDSYEHSTWLSMMKNRLQLDAVLLNKEAAHFVSADESELHRLISVLDSFGRIYHGLFTWRRTRTGGHLSTSFNQLSDYIVVTTNPHEPRLYGGQADPEESQPLVKATNQRKVLCFPSGSIKFLDFHKGKIEAGFEGTGTNPVRCLTDIKVSNGCNVGQVELEGPFVWTQTKLESEIANGAKVIIKRHLNLQPRFFRRPVGHKPFPSLGDSHFPVGTNEDGSEELGAILGSKDGFDYPKPVQLLERIVQAKAFFDKMLFVLDYFAGSGTTGHAVINLNREDGGRRKFILVEMGEYFDTVLLPRIKKVTFTPEWKDGKPKRLPTEEEAEPSLRIVKVLRLESYEDALNNIAFNEESGQKALALYGDEYLLRYMLRWEAKKSETLMDVEKLRSPFSYKLHIHRDGETREQTVDIPETFNYLIGLEVEKRQPLQDGGRRYLVCRGTTRDGRRVAVIWRETRGWTEEDYKRDAAFVVEHKLTEGADEVFVNGDSVIPGARSLDGVFKARLIGQAEA